MAAKPAAGSLVHELVARPAVRTALAWPSANAGRLAEETIRITEIPAPPFDEGRRAMYVAQRLSELGLDAVELADDGNVYALLPGADAAAWPALAVFAHLDTVFGADVPVAVTARDGRLFAPGVGDNSAGVAGVLSALQAMRHASLRPKRPIWIVATVGEEGLGDLRGARAATDRLAGSCPAVVAVEGSFFGRLSHVAVGSRRWRVTLRGPGGHSWHDFGRPSAVHALLRAGAAITRLQLPAEPRTTLNIGEVQGGTGVNVIAEQASCVLDMRSSDAGELDRLAQRVQRILDDETGNGVTVDIAEVGNRPAGGVPARHPLVQTCAAVLDYLGVTPLYAAASTDANVPLGRGIPAVTLGVTRGGGAHTRGEWVEVAPIVQGVQQLILAFCALAEQPPTP